MLGALTVQHPSVTHLKWSAINSDLSYESKRCSRSNSLATLPEGNEYEPSIGQSSTIAERGLLPTVLKKGLPFQIRKNSGLVDRKPVVTGLLPKFRGMQNPGERAGGVLSRCPKGRRKTKRPVLGKVVSFASARDGNIAFETNNGGLMIKHLAEILCGNPTNGLTNRMLYNQLLKRFADEYEIIKAFWRREGKPEEQWSAPDIQVCFAPEKLWEVEFSLRLQI